MNRLASRSTALRSHRPFLLYLWSRSFSRFCSQIAAVAVGWQIYELTGSAFDLGMVGLVQFLPTGVLVFVASLPGALVLVMAWLQQDRLGGARG